jgi:ABC-type phosphate transport system permease subunit
MLPAALVLAIMVLPTITAISRDAIAAVPSKIREAAFGLGATKWEAILLSVQHWYEWRAMASGSSSAPHRPRAFSP